MAEEGSTERTWEFGTSGQITHQGIFTIQSRDLLNRNDMAQGLQCRTVSFYPPSPKNKQPPTCKDDVEVS